MSIPKISMTMWQLAVISALTKVLTGIDPRPGNTGGKESKPERKGRRRLSCGGQVGRIRNAPETKQYVIVNADEGDPGA